MLGGRITLLFIFHISVGYSRQLSNTYIKDERFSVVPKHLVLQIIEQASENQCLHRCRRKELCKIIAYNRKARMCKLLKEAPERQEDTDNGGSVNQEQLVFQFDNQGMVSTNHPSRLIKISIAVTIILFVFDPSYLVPRSFSINLINLKRCSRSHSPVSKSGFYLSFH